MGRTRTQTVGPVSWFATKYAWRCTSVKGSVKLLLLALAWRVPTGCYDTEPTSLVDLEDLTGITTRHLRDCRAELLRIGEVEQCGRGKLAIYRLPKLAGPLFLVQGKAEKTSGISFRNAENISGFDPEKISAGNRKRLPSRAGGVPFSDGVRTSVHHHDDQRASTAAQIGAVHRFLDWFVEQFPIHNGGQSTSVDDDDADVALRLLTGRPARSVEQLQAMALAMWTATPADDAWIPTTDRSIRVLRKAARTLARLATRPVPPAPWSCPHVEPCSHRAMCDVKHANPAKYAVKQEATG
jgi:hypothetical protein